MSDQKDYSPKKSYDSKLKWVALFCLVVQNSGLALMMRYTLAFSSSTDKYLASSAVFAAEILKFVLSCLFCLFLDAKGDLNTFKTLCNDELSNSLDWLKLTVPSMLYTLQNSLQYFSMTQLSAPVFQVIYQMKIVTTAIFSVIILSRKISNIQWAAILALTGGVALVQLSQTKISAGGQVNSFVGLISVICGCLTSGFAGVYFEMVLKSSKVSIWIRNIQLSVIGAIMSLVSSKLAIFNYK
jgi:UDP-sugar transporter A1/2/3